MGKFMLLFRGEGEAMKTMSPLEMQEHMQKWGTWLQGLKESGKLIDGYPLDTSGNVVKNNGKIITDGPFTEVKEVVGGFLLVQANDRSEAIKTAQGCPGLEFGNYTVEVRAVNDLKL